MDEVVKVFFNAVPISLNGQADNVHPDSPKTITRKARSHSVPTAGIGLSLMSALASGLC